MTPRFGISFCTAGTSTLRSSVFASAARLHEIPQITTPLAEVNDASAREALSLGFGDFEDALQVVVASACGANCIVTRDVADFSKSEIVALTPRQPPSHDC